MTPTFQSPASYRVLEVAIIALTLLVPLPAWAQPYDYFCIFASQTAAQTDATVGKYWTPAVAPNADNPSGVPATWDMSTTFPGISVSTPAALINGISALTGWWIIISTASDNAALDAETNCVMKLDRQAAISGKPFVAAATLTGTSRTSLKFSPVPQGSFYPRPLGQ